MISRSIPAFAALALVAIVSACSDVTNPTRTAAPATPRFSGGPVATGAGGAPAGGTGGSSQVSKTAPACGTFTTTTFPTGIYTTQIAIGFGGWATNCGTARETLEVTVVDDNIDPVCRVNVPHSIAARATSAGAANPWRATSTLVHCRNTLHTFTLTLRDTQTNQDLASTTTSFFF